MATVPVYGQQQVQLERAPTIRDSRTTTPDDFGAGAAAGVQALADRQARAYVDQRQKEVRDAREVRVLGMKAEYDRQIAPKQAEWSQRKGLDAQKSIDEFDVEHRKLVDKITADADPESRRMFDAYATEAYSNGNRQLLLHASGQAKAYEADQYKSRKDLVRTQIAQNYENTMMVESLLFGLKADADQYGSRNGWAPEVKKDEQSTIDSMGVRARIEGYLDAGKDMTAKDVFDGNKERLTALDLKDMRVAVEAGSTKGEAQRKGDDVFLKVASGKMTSDEAISELMKIKEPKVREQATAHYRSMIGMRNEARAAETQVAWDDAMRALVENNGQITAVPTSAMTRLAQLDPENITKLNRIASSWDNGQKTDSMAWLSLRNDAISGDLAKMDTVEFHDRYYGKFSRADWDNAVGTWATAHAAETRADKKSAWDEITSGYRNERQAIDDALRANGYDPKLIDQAKPGTDEAKSAAFLATTLDRALAGEKANQSAMLGKKVTNLNPKDIDRVVGEVLKTFAKPAEGKGVMPWNWFNAPKGSAITSDTAQGVAGRMAFGINEVPDGDRELIRSAYKTKHGREPTPSEIVGAYNQSKAR